MKAASSLFHNEERAKRHEIGFSGDEGISVTKPFLLWRRIAKTHGHRPASPTQAQK